jgi:P27 family predicted phage terminase small subunit
LLKQLEELGLLAKCDTDLFELYCVTYGKYRTALEDVNANGLTIVGVKGNVMRNPAAIELHQSMEKLAKLMPELGLTPSARARLIADQAEDVDPFLEFLEASKN